MTISPPVYSAAIMLRHQEWEKHVRKKQVNIKTSMDTKLVQLKAASIQDAVAIDKFKNEIKDIVYQQGQEQEVPYNITESKKLKFSNKSKHTVTV